jgi:hypothetical protein
MKERVSDRPSIREEFPWLKGILGEEELNAIPECRLKTAVFLRYRSLR